MWKAVCAAGLGPIGFMTSLVSCDETSVPICGQLGAPGAGMSRVYEVWPKLFTSWMCAALQSGTCEHSGVSFLQAL